MNLQDFKKGQRVWMYDEDEMPRSRVRGTITEVITENECIWIQWDDLMEPTKHEADEFIHIHSAQ